MDKKYYTSERSQQILISLLKQNNIRKIIASPGTTNLTFVASCQQDSFFEMYSSVDERSAAYIACGLAEESGEPVVITCTGATASRNYLPGLTEAYYRKLPILAVTATQTETSIGHLVAQVIDRSQLPKDTCVLSEHIPVCKDSVDEWSINVKLNRAIMALTYRGGGPVHINLATEYSKDFSVQVLPQARLIKRITTNQDFPNLPKGRIAILVGAHHKWSDQLTKLVDLFCSKYNAIVFSDHGGNYKGHFRASSSLLGSQDKYSPLVFHSDLLIHLGEVTGDYSISQLSQTKQIWRVNEDGELRDKFKKLSVLFEMSEISFFQHYVSQQDKLKITNEYLEEYRKEEQQLVTLIPELPFSNLWIAQQSSQHLPENSVLHLGILNSLRSWNFFNIPNSVNSYINTGGFGIDGGMSSCLGGLLANPKKLHFLVIGDLAFFYDMNVLGNHHISSNLRILMINNGKGTEFRNYNHPGSAFGETADQFIAAGGHYGAKSPHLIKHYATDLGFEYMSASTKEEYNQLKNIFFSSDYRDKPILFEVFTDSHLESQALMMIRNLYASRKEKVKDIVKQILPQSMIELAKKMKK